MKAIKIPSSSISHVFNLKTFVSKSSKSNFFSSPYCSSRQIVAIDEIGSKSSSISSPLYNFLPDTENPNKTVNLICSALKHGNLGDTNQQGGLYGHSLTSSVISRVLLRCQSDSCAALSFFDWARCVNSSRSRLDTLNYCLIIQILAWSAKYSQAMEILTELVKLTPTSAKEDLVFKSLIDSTRLCNWNPAVFDMLIKAYLRARMLKCSFRAFQNAAVLGFSPSITTVNLLLNALSQSNRFVEFWQVYDELERIEVHPNSCTFNILIHALCKNGDMDKVNEFLEKMEEEEGFEPDIFTYNMLVDSYCKRGRLKDAVYLYHIMYKRGVPPDLITYTTLISGFCKGGNVKDAHQLFLRMVHRGFKPDIISYNTLLLGFCKEGMMHEARSVLHNMIENGVCPDNFSCWALVEGYKKQGKLISALNLVIELHRFGVTVSHDVHEYLVVSLCKENRPFAAKSLLSRILQEGFEPNVEIYRDLIVSLCSCNYVDEALLLKAEMVSKKLNLCLDTYKAIINALCVSSRSLEANLLMREMIDSGLRPDTEICRALISGHCHEKNILEAKFLLCYFAEQFQILDTSCYNEVVCLLGERGDASELMEFQDQMMKIGFSPNQLTCKYVVVGLQKAMKTHKNNIMVH